MPGISDPTFSFDSIVDLVGKVGTNVYDKIKGFYTKSDGSTDWKNVLATGTGIYSLLNTAKGGGGGGGDGGGGGIGGIIDGLIGSNQQPTGYQGGIPKYTAVRAAVPDAFTPTTPGAPNRRYFSDVQYTPKGESVADARAAAAEQAAGLASLQMPPVDTTTTTGMAAGGLTAMKKGKYLNGDTDGMSDEISTSIDDSQPAALSDGEFVIPADVVSHLGNGNSQAGAKRLYEMMDKVRAARTGTKKQGKQINPNKLMPA
jgi:hypothetical protein